MSVMLFMNPPAWYLYHLDLNPDNTELAFTSFLFAITGFTLSIRTKQLLPIVLALVAQNILLVKLATGHWLPPFHEPPGAVEQWVSDLNSYPYALLFIRSATDIISFIIQPSRECLAVSTWLVTTLAA